MASGLMQMGGESGGSFTVRPCTEHSSWDDGARRGISVVLSFGVARALEEVMRHEKNAGGAVGFGLPVSGCALLVARIPARTCGTIGQDIFPLDKATQLMNVRVGTRGLAMSLRATGGLRHAN